jgi:hypothetical protein
MPEESGAFDVLPRLEICLDWPINAECTGWTAAGRPALSANRSAGRATRVQPTPPLAPHG